MRDNDSTRRSDPILREFLDSEAAGGLILMAAAAGALLIAQSPLATAYFETLRLPLGPLDVQHWVNDGLMAVFFLLVGLEVKRELHEGQLATWPSRVLPGLAALGGMIAPAAIYIALNLQTPHTLRGWATPAATDIAFALGVLALLGRRAPASLKVFVTALAIIDDLGAIAIIALFYTSQLSLPWLAASLGALAVLIILNRIGVSRLAPYVIGGIVLWGCVLNSGVHATLAGVALALVIPLGATADATGREPEDSPLHRLEHGLQRWVAFGVVPIFGFANAGIDLSDLSLEHLLAPVTLGVAAGLFVGKQIGVFLTTWAAIRLRLAEPPEGASSAHLYGASLLCGIGFTMSLFIGLLAFPDNAALQSNIKLGVLIGSLLSALAATLVLVMAARGDEPRT